MAKTQKLRMKDGQKFLYVKKQQKQKLNDLWRFHLEFGILFGILLKRVLMKNKELIYKE
jgi:hypothetical protein